MKNLERHIIVSLESFNPILNYFSQSELSENILMNEDRKKLIEIDGDRIKQYELLVDMLKKNALFVSIKHIDFELQFAKNKIKSNNGLEIGEFFKNHYYREQEETEFSLISCIKDIKSSSEKNIIDEMQYFLIKALYHFPNIIDELNNEERYFLKKDICKIFENLSMFEEKEQLHLIIEKLIQYFESKINYLRKEIIKNLKINSFTELKKNRQNLFSFLKNFSFPFISKMDCQYSERIVTELNTIIKQHPEKIDQDYYSVFSNTLEQLKKIIIEIELNITFFASTCLLPILHLVHRIIQDEHNSDTESTNCELTFIRPDKKFLLQQTEAFELEIPIYYFVGNSQAQDVYVELFSPGNELEINAISRYCKYLSDDPRNKQFNAKFEIRPLRAIENEAQVKLCISWKSIFGKQYKKEKELILKNINPKINWQTLREIVNPYSLDPKEKIEDLIGRDSIIKTIKQGLRGCQSFSISGQKRVGKTSVAKSVFNFLLHSKEEEFISHIPAYLSIGDVSASPDPMGYLGYMIAKEIEENFKLKRGFPPTHDPIELREYENNLTKLILYLKDIIRSYPDIKIIIFIDEFDEIPQSLYQAESGKNFFMALRSLTEMNFVALCTIGGEKMSLILNYQGTKLNKLKDIDVDYFDILKNKEDLKDLILLPILEYNLDLSESAIDCIIEYSAGNPYYIMIICNFCFDEIVNKEISSADRIDIEKIIRKQLEILKVTHFQHYWEDGKIGTEAELAWWGYYNSRILILLSQLSINHSSIPLSKIFEVIENDKLIEKKELETYFDELKRRKLILKNENDEYKIRVKLFADWLKIKGKEEINLLYKNSHYLSDAISASKRYDYTEDNIRSLEKRFETYYLTIGKEDIRNYLNQFFLLQGKKGAWYAYKILENTRIFSRSEVDRYFKELFQEKILSDVKEIYDVREGTHKTNSQKIIGPTIIKSIKYQNIILSRIDAEGKSGAEMLRIFASTNGIIDKSVMASKDIKGYLDKNSNMNFIIIFVDDFIGTGDSATDNFNKFFNEFPQNYFDKHSLYYCVICADSQGIEKLNSKFNSFRKILSYKILSEEDKAFSEQSRIFLNTQDRVEAERVFKLIGEQLEKRHPLGYKNMQALTVFWDNAPNDTLPALIKSGRIKIKNESRLTEWIPLFARK